MREEATRKKERKMKRSHGTDRPACMREKEKRAKIRKLLGRRREHASGRQGSNTGKGDEQSPHVRTGR